MAKNISPKSPAAEDVTAMDVDDLEDAEKKLQDILLEIKEHMQLIEKSVALKETRFVVRVLRMLPIIRRKLSTPILHQVANDIYPTGIQLHEVIDLMPAVVEQVPVKTARTVLKSPIAQVDAYYHLLLLIKLIDDGNLQKALICGNVLMDKIGADNTPTMQLLAARSYFYYTRAAELNNTLYEIRQFLMKRLRTATLHNNYEVQAVLINCLLRNYLHYSLFEQADKLIKQTIFPEAASNNEWARYLFYNGRIKVTKLEYSDGHKHLIRAMRKAPQQAALGFRQIVQKFIIVVELLLGVIPERTVYNQTGMSQGLVPYLKLTQIVRLGDVQGFADVMDKYADKFLTDNTYMLITRLHHSVVKTAIRQIGLSYSRISLADIAQRLMLDSVEDAEFVVSKAIREGVLEGTIDPDCACLSSKAPVDIYKSREPQIAFHERIAFCLGLHNETVKALRFPKKEETNVKTPTEKALEEQEELEAAAEELEEF